VVLGGRMEKEGRKKNFLFSIKNFYQLDLLGFLETERVLV
jgi:hypothetical protein